jgi:hypothetical protein
MAISTTGGWGLAATAAYPVVAMATNAIVGSQIDPISAGVLGLEAMMASEATTRWFNPLRLTGDGYIDWAINTAVQCFLCHYIAEYFSNAIGLCPIEFGQTSYLALIALIGLMLFTLIRSFVAPYFAGPNNNEHMMVNAMPVHSQFNNLLFAASEEEGETEGGGRRMRQLHEQHHGHAHSHGGSDGHGHSHGPGTPGHDAEPNPHRSRDGTPDSRQRFRVQDQPSSGAFPVGRDRRGALPAGEGADRLLLQINQQQQHSGLPEDESSEDPFGAAGQSQFAWTDSGSTSGTGSDVSYSTGSDGSFEAHLPSFSPFASTNSGSHGSHGAAANAGARPILLTTHLGDLLPVGASNLDLPPRGDEDYYPTSSGASFSSSPSASSVALPGTGGLHGRRPTGGPGYVVHTDFHPQSSGSASGSGSGAGGSTSSTDDTEL